MLIDYSDWSNYDGAAEGSGRSDKRWIKNNSTEEQGVFKFPKTLQTTEHISEKIACDLAGLINLDCARVEIGMYEKEYINANYRKNVLNILQFIIQNVTESNICNILNQFTTDYLSENRKKLILLFLLKKVDVISEIFFKEN